MMLANLPKTEKGTARKYVREDCNSNKRNIGAHMGTNVKLNIPEDVLKLKYRGSLR